MSVRFIHTGDVHIGTAFANASFGREIGEKRRQEIKESFFLTLDSCKEKDVELLLISGDLFDEEYITLSDLKDVKNKFEALENVRIVICAGNHDALISETSSYRLMKWGGNVHIFDKELECYSLDHLNTDIYSFSWNKKLIKEMDFSDLTILNPSRFNILMLHGDISSNSNYLPLNLDQLLTKGFDYIALGHIHKPQIINSRAAYCGSLEPLNFKEQGAHGFVMGVYDESELKLNFIPFSKREFIEKRVEINEDMSFEEIREFIYQKVVEELNEDALYRIIITGIKDINVALNRALIKETVERVAFYCEVEDETRNNYDLDRIKIENAGNIVEEFISYMEEIGLEDPQNKDALNVGLSILLKERIE